MNRRKRFLAGLLSLAICLSLLPSTARAATNDWSDWAGQDSDSPQIESLTISGHTFEQAKYTADVDGFDAPKGYIIVDGNTGVTKEQVKEALGGDLSTCVTPAAGSGAIAYNKLSEDQKKTITSLYSWDAQMGKDFYEKELGAADDTYVNNIVTNNAELDQMTGLECVGKLYCIAWKDGAGDYYAKEENWVDPWETGTSNALIQLYVVFYKEGEATTPEWTDWMGTDSDTPQIENLTINGQTFEQAKYTADVDGFDAPKGYIIVDGNTGVTKEQVKEALGGDLSTCVTPAAGSGAIAYNKLSEDQKKTITSLYSWDAQMGKDFYEKELGAADDTYVNNIVTNNAELDQMTGLECVGKLYCIAWKDGAGDYYAKEENWVDPWETGTSNALIQLYAVFYKPAEATTPEWSITSVNAERVSLYERYAGIGNIVVYTEDAPTNAKLVVEEVADVNGTEMETPTTGLTFGAVGPISNGTATFTVHTTADTPAGTYYFKVSDQAGTTSCVGSFQVTKTYAVHLAVSPAAVAKEWTMYARVGSDIAEASGTVYLPKSVEDKYGSYLTSMPSLPIKDGEENLYYLCDHPTEGETYDGTVYLLDHYEVTKDGEPCDTVTRLNGTPLHNLKEERNGFGEQTFLMPDFGDFTITAVFAEAYQVDLGDLKDHVGYYTFYEWYREGDTVDLSNIVSNANNAAEASGQVVDKVTVYKTGAPSTVVAEFEPEGQFSSCKFTMPEYGVSVVVTYTEDTVGKLEEIGSQEDVLIAGNSGTATIDVTTGNIADGTQLHITPCLITGTATTVEGLTLSISPVQDNKATITVTTTDTVKEDTYYFKLSMPDGTPLTQSGSRPYHGSITVSSSSTKAIQLGAQNGVLTAGTAGTATFTGTAANIAEGTSVTVQETDAAGTPQAIGATEGLDLTATKIKEGVFTVTATITAEVPAGNYYFKAIAGDETSQVVTITVGSKEAQTYQVTIQTSQNGTVTADKTTVSAGEQVTLTISPSTGYALDTISVTQTGGGSVVLSGDGNTRTFTMPAADVIVNAVFEEDAGAGTKYLVNSQTYLNGYVSISTQSAAEGETVTLTAKPNQGYVLASISVTKDDGSSVALSGTGDTRTFKMPASNVTVNATFAEEGEPFPVKVSAVPGGTITVSPTQAREGETVTVTVTPDSGMQMVPGSLKYSEASAGGAVVEISGYTFTMPGIEVSVSCQFEKIPSGTDSQVQITSFIINGVSAAINNESRIITIVLPYGTDLSNVAPVITGVNIQSISPASAQRVNLRYPRTYTVYGTDGTTVTYTVSAYTEEPTPAIQLWEKLQDHINSTDNWWELAEWQKINGYYGDYNTPENLATLREYLDDVTAQYGTRRATLNYYSSSGRLVLEPSSYSMSGTSYRNTLDFPRRTLSNLDRLGYPIVTYNLRELQIDIYETMETTTGFEITVSAPSSTVRSKWNNLSGSGRLFEIEASSTRAGMVLRIPVGDVSKSDLSLMRYDYTKARFVEVERDSWRITNGYLVTNKVSAGIYGLRDR